MIDRKHDFLAVRVGTIRIGRRCEAADNGIAIEIRVAHVEVLFGGVIGRKSYVEKPPLAATVDMLHDVQEWRLFDNAVPDDADPPPLLDHEDAPTTVTCVRDLYRQVQSGNNLFEFPLGRATLLHWIGRRRTVHSHLSPSHPTRAVNSANQHLVNAARWVNCHIQGPSIFRMSIDQPLV